MGGDRCLDSLFGNEKVGTGDLKERVLRERKVPGNLTRDLKKMERGM